MAKEGTTPTIQQMKREPGFMLLAMGVLLPLVTLGVELTTRMCTDAIFDPLPTMFHILLVAFVPLANFLAWRALRLADVSPGLALLNGVAIGIAAFYSVVFLPLIPIAALVVVYFGLGLLPLAPLLSLIASILLRMHLSRFARNSRLRAPLWPGLVAGLLALLAIELPATVTRIGMEIATAEAHETRLRGIQWLRIAGSEEVLLRHCYPRSGRGTDMVGSLFSNPISVQQAQELYYRVTGTAFNSIPTPPSRAADRWFVGGDWDSDQGSVRVGGRLQDLSLASSRMDGSMDANAAVAYLEWTMVFRNAGTVQKEARAQIGLPPGAVVSRVTLWINGEEREAAFAGRGKVRAAYESVVSQSRDPVLVTSAGKDRVSMQLFPVPPAGEMKVRLGITVPMRLEKEHNSLLSLPYFHERNFEFAPALRHALWVESKSPLRNGVAAGTPIPGGFSLRTELDELHLGEDAAIIVAERSKDELAWVADTRAPGQIVRQHFVHQTSAPPKRLVVVIDGSAAMRDVASQLAAALAKLPEAVELDLIFAGEATNVHTGGLTAKGMAEHIGAYRYTGGQDNAPQLARGLDLLSGQGDALLWVHGPQPVSLEPVEPLLQRLERLSFRPVWYEVQVRPGANRVGEKLDGLISPTMLSTEALHRLIGDWHSGAKRPVAVRERVAAGMKPPDAAGKTSDHLARLWAADEIERLAQAGKERALAIRLAQTYQLVTSVSGAVVLETKEQYDRAGLEPVDAGTVPTVPEPEVWALLIIAFVILLHAYARRRFSARTNVAA
jgi:hypothetical protein